MKNPKQLHNYKKDPYIIGVRDGRKNVDVWVVPNGPCGHTGDPQLSEVDADLMSLLSDSRSKANDAIGKIHATRMANLVCAFARASNITQGGGVGASDYEIRSYGSVRRGADCISWTKTRHEAYNHMNTADRRLVMSARRCRGVFEGFETDVGIVDVFQPVTVSCDRNTDPRYTALTWRDTSANCASVQAIHVMRGHHAIKFNESGSVESRGTRYGSVMRSKKIAYSSTALSVKSKQSDEEFVVVGRNYTNRVGELLDWNSFLVHHAVAYVCEHPNIIREALDKAGMTKFVSPKHVLDSTDIGWGRTAYQDVYSMMNVDDCTGALRFIWDILSVVDGREEWKPEDERRYRLYTRSKAPIEYIVGLVCNTRPYLLRDVTLDKLPPEVRQQVLNNVKIANGGNVVTLTPPKKSGIATQLGDWSSITPVERYGTFEKNILLAGSVERATIDNMNDTETLKNIIAVGWKEFIKNFEVTGRQEVFFPPFKI